MAIPVRDKFGDVGKAVSAHGDLRPLLRSLNLEGDEKLSVRRINGRNLVGKRSFRVVRARDSVGSTCDIVSVLLH